MAYTDIDKPSDYFNTKLYTGDDTSPRTITGVNFQPDFTWIKRRDNSGANHILFDSVRGAGSNKELLSNSTASEGGGLASAYGYLSAFASDGFTLTDGTDPTNEDLYTNQSGATFVSWNWLAGGTAVSNTAGSITSSVSANTTAGFSIVSYTGTLASATVGHGLGAVPKVIIVKNRTTVDNWGVYTAMTGNTSKLRLNGTNATITGVSSWDSTTPTSSVFSLGSDSEVNNNTASIAYCFAEKKGFSKFSSYVGNGSSDGTFTYLGFRPAMIIFKRTNSASQWKLFDTKRTTSNVMGNLLYPNGADAEATGQISLDFLSNGFKIRETGVDLNASGSPYIYMAFAESPFTTSTGIPTTAR